MNPNASDFPLLFQWEAPRVRRGTIVLFLIVSLFAHAVCFYLFQIVYPPTVALLPPPARVTLITANSGENQTLLHWIDSEDPALAFTTVRPAEGKLRALPKIGHVPSYETHQPLLREAPPFTVDLRGPSARPPGPVAIPRGITKPNIDQKIPTTISFSEELDSAGVATVPPLRFTASTNEASQNMRFRVAIGPRGEVRYCFPLTSSGDPAMDEQGRRAIALCRFQEIRNPQSAIPNSLVWGVVTIDWGNDVVPPAAAIPTKSSTP